MRPGFDRLIVTCEHASNRIPAAHQGLFRGQAKHLRSHRGFDLGAKDVASRVARTLRAPLFLGTHSRLLIDLNRSRGHTNVFSEISSRLSDSEKQDVVDKIYAPYREAVESEIRSLVQRGKRVLHISVHSFTPELAGEVRNADVGILYDPKRRHEARLAAALYGGCRALAPALRIRRNYPYVGYSDGFTTYLRRRFADSSYAGIEWEMNQKLALSEGGPRLHADLLVQALTALQR